MIHKQYDCELSIFIPLHNEEKSFPLLQEKVERAFELLHLERAEIIYVDDGSTDSTHDRLTGITGKYPLQIIRHRKRLGLTAAMRNAFRIAKGRYVIFLPGDLESDPEEDIPKLYHALQSGYDIVSGSRVGRRDGKVFASKIYNLVCRALFKLDLHDMNWIKGFRREVIEDLELRSDWHRFIIMIAADRGYSVTEVPVNWHRRKGGRSKFGLLRMPISFFDVMAVKFLLVFRKKPMLFYGTVAFSCISVGFLIGFVLAGLYVVSGVQLRPLLQFSFFVTLMGVFVLMIGFLSEQIASLQERIDRLEESIKK